MTLFIFIVAFVTWTCASVMWGALIMVLATNGDHEVLWDRVLSLFAIIGAVGIATLVVFQIVNVIMEL